MEQVIKLTGRVAKVFPAQSGVSARTGNAWMSQEFVCEYHAWSGANYPNRIVCRIFGEDRIKQWAPKELEENVTVILSPDASEGKEGRWFNEMRVTNFKRANEPKAAQCFIETIKETSEDYIDGKIKERTENDNN